MSDENKLNVKFEWFPEFGKLLINLVWPGLQAPYTRLLHCNVLLAATWKNYGLFSKPQKVHGRQTLDVQEAVTPGLRTPAF